MSEQDKEILERQEELLGKMSPVEQQMLLVYGEGLLAGKELAGTE